MQMNKNLQCLRKQREGAMKRITMKKFGHKRWFMTQILILLIVFAMTPSVHASSNTKRRVVKVAFPEQAGMSQIGQTGIMTGYNYDYLEKISEFTGWEMEYIAYPSEDGNEAISNAMNDLIAGKVDLLGPMLKNEQTEQMFEYPEKSYGTVYTTLCADVNSTIRRIETDSSDVIKVGLWKTAENRNSEVINYLEMENVNYKIKYYSTADAQQEALHDGKVDLISGGSLSPMDNTRIIAKFAARPYYFAATKGNTELVKQLDDAMQQISELQPELQNKLFNTYFMDTVNTFSLTDDQKKMLAEKQKIRVLCVDNDAPYVYQKNGEAYGSLVLAINDFANEVGLTPEYTFCENKSEAEKILSKEKYDFLIGIPYTSSFCAENGFIRSDSVFDAGMTFVRNKSVDSDYKNETVGTIEGLEDSFEGSKFQKVVLFDDAKECISALKKGKVDVVAGDRSVMDYYIYEDGSSMLTAAISGKTHDVCIAVSRENDLSLLGILNNYINNLSTYKRTVYLDNGNAHENIVSMSRILTQHPVLVTAVVILLTALILTIVFMMIYSSKMGRKNLELVKANQAKSDFLSRMSHDIRTPLNGIIGLLKLDVSHLDNQKLIEENHKKMMVSADHLLSLLNDVLQMGKLDDGNVALEHELIDLNDLSQDVVTIIKERAVEAGIQWEYKRKNINLNDNYVYGSSVHLRQIFLNIYGNCIKFSKPGGKIITEVNVLEEKEGIRTYQWKISDTGIGMSEEFVQHIFEPFIQEKNDARSVYQGTGLGMTIVKKMLDQMGGTISVSSKKDVGSEFVITIPLEIASVVQQAKVEETDIKEDIQGRHLMVVEDNELNAEIIEMLLTDQGAEVKVVYDGKQAVDLFKESPEGTFDAILMDIMMPVMDGLTATKTIRALKKSDAKKIPIIAVTANAFKEDEENCMKAGMNAYMTKPFVIEKAKQVISEQIKRAA